MFDATSEGQRQLERAARLVDVGVSSRGSAGRRRTPAHKSLEQLFGEARTRSQQQGPSGAALYGHAGSSQLLQEPKAQRLDREVADFKLDPSGAGRVEGETKGSSPEDHRHLSAREFFSLRHERTMLGVVEEANRDCWRSFNRHSSDRIHDDWEEAKAQIMGTMAPQNIGLATAGSALHCGPSAGGSDLTSVAPMQDTAIIDFLLQNPVTPTLVQKVCHLSISASSAYSDELSECWGIICHSLQPSARQLTCGSLKYLQDSYAEGVKHFVYSSMDARLGGAPDAWSLILALGRLKFETDAFPTAAQHIWYAAYVAARAGLAHLLLELPNLAGHAAALCPFLDTVCKLMAKRLHDTAVDGQLKDFPSSGVTNETDLLHANMSEGNNQFHDILLSLLLNKTFPMGRLTEGTVEDWLWFRLHTLHSASGSSLPLDGGLEFAKRLSTLRQKVLEVNPSHFDPLTGVASSPEHGGMVRNGGRGMGYGGLGVVGHREPPAAWASAGIAGGAQTLNFVKVLLLTAQFSRAIQQLRTQDHSLQGPALHMALVLSRAGKLDAVQKFFEHHGILQDPIETPLSIPSLVYDYTNQFGCGAQLQYLRILDLEDRMQALQRLLLLGGVGTNDDLIGYINADGRHEPGLLERTLHQDGLGDQAEFRRLCQDAGRRACEQGQYREGIRLYHLGRCYSEVLQVLCRCLRLPIWREPSPTDDAAQLDQDIRRFFSIYERSLATYGISAQEWAVARKLYAARQFHGLCDGGQPEAALDIFDREALLPLSAQQPLGSSAFDGRHVNEEVLVEYPQIVSDYVRILTYAAWQGTVSSEVLGKRVWQLQAMLAVYSRHVALDADTAAALANLSLAVPFSERGGWAA